MANELTGDFDVVAEFSLPVVNRLLAAMHGIKRFPHSLALRVDDIPPPPDHVRPKVFEIIDVAGDPVENPRRIRVPAQIVSPSSPTTGPLAAIDAIVNLADAGIFIPLIEPSKLQGRAQLQLSPPTLEIADAAASKVTVRLRAKSRYFADPGTPPASEFARGDMVITTAVSQITSQAGNVVDIDLRSNAVQAAFVPAWSSRVLSAEDRAGIDLLIGNALKSSVLPSNNTLPANIRSMKFKALGGQEQAIAILLNTNTAPGNPATVNRVFLGGHDFAFGAGVDTIMAAIQPALDEILATPVPPFPVSVPLVFTSASTTYTVKLNTTTAELQTGRVLFRITGRATSPDWFAPNFNFTVTQAFDLEPDGSTANLVVGAMTLDTTSWLVDIFRGRAMGPMAAARDRALGRSGVMSEVRRMLDADRNLGGFLRSLLTPARPDDEPQPQPLGVTLAYSSVEIAPAGVVLRGTLAVADPAPAHVEFSEIPASGGGPLGAIVPAGPEHSAFKSWIPGGTIESYEWKRAGEAQPGPRDENTFVLLPPEPVFESGDGTDSGGSPGPIRAFEPMCVTIRGSRLSASGVVRSEQVNASYCAFQWFPLFDVTIVGNEPMPLVPLTRPGRHGKVEIVGHAPAVRDDKSRATPNLIVHFGGATTADGLEGLTDALRKSGRTDAPTAVVAVLPRAVLESARRVPDIVYIEEHDAWPRMWGVHVGRRPATFVIGPAGKVLWEREGEIELSSLVEALRRVLVTGKRAKVSTVTTGVRIGHPPPNFLFSHAAGHELTLRKLIGRPVILVFWRSDARLSLDAIQSPATVGHPAGKAAVVLAINDGETPDAAARSSASVAAGVTVVPDPSRSISRAFGISAWPTVVLIDARGIVRDVRHGTSVIELADPGLASTGAPAAHQH